MSTPATKGSGFDWKMLLATAAVGVSAVSVIALLTQNSNASLGRQVKRNVIRFLQDSGSTVGNGIIAGGMLKVPMKIDTAVNSVVISMINTCGSASSAETPQAKAQPAGDWISQKPAQTGEEAVAQPPAASPAVAPIPPKGITPKGPKPSENDLWKDD